ncbi:hypothetical protein [Sporomusa acidovorans]|uniref:Uncharacterized protein n=1 Tax=Sporomusa acidovorans (strain ATCC 49682 / DSM 3132 / Mol) TaxID=1123286 RepID=A0ABZ3IXW6_SPOA4|nr:hypothetical protein [Sporomusa acidovorans]OZC23324.1 hypothetical protein SPACI_07360 [Sporomusa acidovorans DSM 3132]SDE41916.1 hypothetical protein SAMN04488499_101338 [Sporomusa acidovorans]
MDDKPDDVNDNLTEEDLRILLNDLPNILKELEAWATNEAKSAQSKSLRY